MGGCSSHPDACGLLERRASPQYPPSPRSSASPAAAPAQPLCSHPRRRDLLQTKRKRGMVRGAGAPSSRTHLPRPSADRVSLGGFRWDPRFSPPNATISTPSGCHLSEGSEFTSFVWMLSAPPPPTPSFATLTSTPAGAEAGGLTSTGCSCHSPASHPELALGGCQAAQPPGLNWRPPQAQDTHQ